MCIYTSLDDFISLDNTSQARGIGSFFKKVKNFFSSPNVKIVIGGAKILFGAVVMLIGGLSEDVELLKMGALTYKDGVIMLWDVFSNNEVLAPSIGSPSGGGGGGGGGASIPTTVAVTGVSLNKTSVSLIVGDAETLIQTITPANATNKAVSWSSSNPDVATVSNSGLVTGLSVGTATITVITVDGNRTAICNVNINPVPVKSVSVKPSSNLVVGGTETLFVVIDPPNATNKSVTWHSDNIAVATVSTNGIVSVVSVGSATITVATVDGNKTALCNVTVGNSAVAVIDISLNKSSTSLDVGDTETLIATISPSIATDQNVTWYSNNTSVATVSPNGTVTALTAGTATITVETDDGGKTASCVVTVISWDVYDETTWNVVVNSIKNGGNNNTYTITVTDNFSIPGVSANTFGSVSNITVTITGDKVISLAAGSVGNLLCIGAKQTVIIRDIDLKGHSANNDSLVYCEANFTMQGNATVSGNTASNSGGGVFVGTSGAFTMQNDATVSGNTASNSGGGVVVFRSGTFTMQDNATVSGNIAGSGGGVGVFSSGTFTTQDNATVSGNTASVYGGGVFVSGTLIMRGGTVYGNDAMPLGNNSDFFGAALCVWCHGEDIGTAKYGDGSNILLFPSTSGLFEDTNNTIIGR
jgi:parallel beta-helix repeat protein